MPLSTDELATHPEAGSDITWQAVLCDRHTRAGAFGGPGRPGACTRPGPARQGLSRFAAPSRRRQFAAPMTLGIVSARYEYNTTSSRTLPLSSGGFIDVPLSDSR